MCNIRVEPGEVQLAGHIRGSKVDAFARGIALLQKNAQRLGTFLTEDQRGKHMPEFLAQLSGHMLKNQCASLAELESLTRNIDHIKDIVAAQQRYAKRCGVTETVAVATLVEDSLAMNRGAFARHGVALIREFAQVPPITVDRHKVLQILVNLERNAKDACDTADRAQKNVTVRIATCERGVQIAVIDNGAGISPEHMTKLFRHGFTTKKDGHGFGLHSAALAAQELGGTREAASEGIDCGATFTLTLPLNARSRRMDNGSPNPIRRVLVIDDNPAIHENFRKILAPPGDSNAGLAAVERAMFGESVATGAAPSFETDSALQG